MIVDLGLGGWHPSDEDSPPDNRGKVMGDGADYALECQGDDWWFPSRRSVGSGSSKTIKCKECGSTSVYWDTVTSGKWCLHTNGQPHVCDTKKPISVPRTGKNSNKKELTGYKLVTVKCCNTCISFNATCDRDTFWHYRCIEHDYNVVPNGLCNNWKQDA
jgi:hypothetical protein